MIIINARISRYTNLNLPHQIQLCHVRLLSCQGKQACQLLASNSIFGDACPGTQKYLEVHYQCLASNSTQLTNLGSASAPTAATPTIPMVQSIQQQQISTSSSSNITPNLATLSAAAAAATINQNNMNNKQQAVNSHHFPGKLTKVNSYSHSCHVVSC